MKKASYVFVLERVYAKKKHKSICTIAGEYPQGEQQGKAQNTSQETEVRPVFIGENALQT